MNYYTINDISKMFGMKEDSILKRAKRLKIEASKTKNEVVKTKVIEKKVEVVKLVEKVIYKPIHTYINVETIPSKMNYLKIEEL